MPLTFHTVAKQVLKFEVDLTIHASHLAQTLIQSLTNTQILKQQCLENELVQCILLLYIKISMERWTWEKPGPQVSWYDDRKVTLDHQDDRQQPASSCLDRSEILENVFEQLLHWYFLTSECVCRWARRLERSANARLQWGHENGFSPEARAHYYITIYFWDC